MFFYQMKKILKMFEQQKPFFYMIFKSFWWLRKLLMKFFLSDAEEKGQPRLHFDLSYLR